MTLKSDKLDGLIIQGILWKLSAYIKLIYIDSRSKIAVGLNVLMEVSKKVPPVLAELYKIGIDD